MLEPMHIVRLAEARQAVGTAQVAAESEPIGAGVMTFEAPGSWANQACGLADGPVTSQELDRLIAFYTERGVEPRVEVCSYAHASVVAGLEARQFVVREFEHVLFHDLQDVRVGASVPGVTASVVDPSDDAVVAVLAETLARGFSTDDAVPAGQDLAITQRIARQPQVRSFLVEVDGEPAGAAQMGIRPPIAGLFGASVRAGFRRRGIHRLLFEARLAQAVSEGCQAVVVESAPGGPTERNARRAGMRLLYTKTIYVRPADGLQRSV